MKIALMNEFSQAAKNPIVLTQLEEVAQQQNHQVFNVGMDGDNDHRLTYIHLGIIASLLLNSKAVDFVVTGCGTGQGALMATNAFPGVACGYCIDPSDAYLFAQINNGNALALPFAKGFGWGAELNIKYIFEKAFSGEKGQGYPAERKESQVANAGILSQLKSAVAKDYLDALEAIDPELIKQAIGGPRFQACFFENCKDEQIAQFVQARL
ncbi:RpiB/LacA/LacB family sugar-phosphate isomerase [Psychrosphaera sp. B3R10]|uniref:RpiB/LacA/LacB family sugar-phosphate isomerase n=1 Tax=unclassified Psychrosphaera TaxID=2641570 RepID=UPI001C09FD81|nr:MULTISPECIES: RpiB/LacA/LacB family sugar-phosphate isomerase [unclassified Psychrosphaera]MBU2881695.1 RpiB/LacA/LacB family sugar-phosphate isomerase [Psychrosphaera sp. I2R16]MBU2991050.1 RpiB/LacA/LacB family sugar-phosphate isomerase [Psychrosphaera sp. B3R10]MDO6718761.1 RpiB/LacA/LacB family sugar-phosphate isomerase [Psychrosphaera sp. 1_MG-2023]